MRRLLKEPLLHFVALGVVIFALNAWREKARPVVASFGDPFLHGFEFAALDAQEITALFGGEFGAQLMTLRQGQWSGPVASSYGLHLVHVEAHEVAEPAPIWYTPGT